MARNDAGPGGSSGAASPGRPTALVTGASSGLGEVFARTLARRGYDLLLVARREDRLAALAHELLEQYGAGAEVFVADLADPRDVARLEQHIPRIDALEMLVNNAGFGTAGRFAEVDVAGQADMIQVHVTAPVRLTRAALPGMVARGTGAVINVASVAGFLTSGGSVTYCATKAYLISFSQSLDAELRATGVRIQALCPGFTYTEFHDTPEMQHFHRSDIPRFLWLSAQYVVDTSLRALKNKTPVCIPSWRYRLIVALVQNPVTGPILRAFYQKGLKR
jgi:hypothetical protein